MKYPRFISARDNYLVGQEKENTESILVAVADNQEDYEIVLKRFEDDVKMENVTEHTEFPYFPSDAFVVTAITKGTHPHWFKRYDS